jgi:predicted HTH transcriptional regulator
MDKSGIIDHVEIHSPPLRAVEEAIAFVHKHLHHVIGRVFHILGLIEQWGSGNQRMTAACHDAGPPSPFLEEIGIRFRRKVPDPGALLPACEYSSRTGPIELFVTRPFSARS